MSFICAEKNIIAINKKNSFRRLISDKCKGNLDEIMITEIIKHMRARKKKADNSLFDPVI